MDNVARLELDVGQMLTGLRQPHEVVRRQLNVTENVVLQNEGNRYSLVELIVVG